MNEAEFQARVESLADNADRTAAEIRALNDEVRGDVHECKRYLALARTAAQESELWLGKAMVAYAGRDR